VDRKIATEFSFFLAIPMIVVASLYDLFLHRMEITLGSLTLIATGFVVAFFSAMVVVKWFIGFISRHDFMPFAVYRLIAGSLALVLLWVLH
jgi:undecaprenyl-diphosphatase